MVQEVVDNYSKNSFEIKHFDKVNFFRENLSFVIVDEEIYLEIIRQKIYFERLILIKTSNKNINNTLKESEIISLSIPFRIRDLYDIISNRIDLMLSQSERIQEFKKFTYDPRVRTLFNKNVSMRLTEKESNIFEYMLLNFNQYITKKVLLKEIWSYSDEIDTLTLETHIYSLRKKLRRT